MVSCFIEKEFNYFENKKLITERWISPTDPYGKIPFTIATELIAQDALASYQTINAQDPQKKTGFKIISSKDHLFNLIKGGRSSFSVKLEGKIYYVALESYNLWRKVNGQLLDALKIPIPVPKSDQLKSRPKELEALVKLLLTPPDQRQAPLPNIPMANNHFEAVSAALSWANKRLEQINDSKKVTLSYRLAAFYLLLASELEINCKGIEELKISSNIFACDTNEQTNSVTVYKLSNDDSNPFEKSYINLDCDLFSSATIFSSPVKAKQLLADLLQKFPNFFDNFTTDLIDEFHQKSISENSYQPLIDLIKMMGRGLEEQFPIENPFPLIFNILEKSFENLTSCHVNQYTADTIDEIAKPVCLLTAFHLLSPAKLLTQDNFNLLICNYDDLKFTIKIPNETFFADLTEVMPRFFPVYATALSGHLYGEAQSTTIVRDEAFAFVKSYRGYKDKSGFAKDFYNYLESTYLKKTVDISFSDATKLMVEQLEKVADLIRIRYWSMYAAGFYAYLSLDELAEEEEENKILRSEEEQIAISQQYLECDLPVITRGETSRFNEPLSFFYGGSANDFVQSLFYQVKSENNGGNCIVGALAQRIWGLHEVDKGRETISILSDESCNNEYVRKIRKGVAQYMRDHIEEFKELIDVKDSVMQRAALIENSNAFFERSELTALSHIIGRPIFTIIANHFRIRNGTIEMDKINASYDTQPVYLYLQGYHGDLLIPKCGPYG